MRRSCFVSYIVIGLVLMLPGVSEAKTEAGGPLEETIAVDCTDPDPTKHGSIQEALDNSKAQSVTVQITGMCQQSVFVNRDNVTLAGASNASDGITGPAFVDPNQRALVTVRDVANIVIDNLAITASESRGLEVALGPTTAFVRNCHIHGNGGRGIQVNDGAYTAVSDTVIEDNGNWQLATFAGTLDCTNCTVGNGSENLGAVATNNGIIILRGSAVSLTTYGVYGSNAAQIFLTAGSTVSGFLAVIAENNAQVQWNGNGTDTFFGAIWMQISGQVFLSGVTQTGNSVPYGIGNCFGDDSFLKVANSTLAGDTYILTYSRANSEGANDLGDNLICSGGGDFWCDGNESKLSSGCGSCP